MPEIFTDVGSCVDAVLRRVGTRIVLALPLGIGKPNPLVNEFYRRARREPAIELTIITALSLLKPLPRAGLERRLLEPLSARVFGDYVEPEYARDLRSDTLPPNVRISEFYLSPGAFLGATHAQRNYLSSNYTHVARDLLARGVNVIAHLVAKRSVDGELQLSWGSNADVSSELLPQLAAQRAAGREILLVGETHSHMPFMGGHARVAPQQFDFLVDDARYDYQLFCPPNAAIGDAEHAIGLHTSGLLRDGGTLQVGIGELGDALVYALLLRHQQNDAWREARAALGAAAADDDGGSEPFSAGLFACSEMFEAQMLELYRAGVLRRRVYDCLPLQRLLDAGAIGERFSAEILALLPGAGAGPALSAEEFRELRHYGVFRSDVEYREGHVRAGDGQWIAADLADAACRRQLAEQCLGRELRHGVVLQAGFFLGPRGFYAALRELPESERAQLDMRGVGFINQLYGSDAELRVLQRRAARFVNTTMMVTLLGAAVSDTLDSGQVVSGVGGQYNFVAMAHALPDARSVLCVRATRTRHGRTSSNILWSYPRETIPRHLRDLVVSEYGVADLRGRTDEEVIVALLNVADSRFQPQLLQQAKAAGKLRADYTIPAQHQANLPGRLQAQLQPLRARGFFSDYPFGTDLTTEEIALARALRYLEARSSGRWARLRLAAAAVVQGAPQAAQRAALERMELAQPRTLPQRLQRRLLALALRRSA